MQRAVQPSVAAVQPGIDRTAAVDLSRAQMASFMAWMVSECLGILVGLKQGLVAMGSGFVNAAALQNAESRTCVCMHVCMRACMYACISLCSFSYVEFPSRTGGQHWLKKSEVDVLLALGRSLRFEVLVRE